MQDQLQQKGLLQALQLLLILRKLDSSIPHRPQSQLQLLGTDVSLLVDAGILGLSGGMFLHTCLKALAPHFTGELCAAVPVCNAADACKTPHVACASCSCLTAVPALFTYAQHGPAKCWEALGLLQTGYR